MTHYTCMLLWFICFSITDQKSCSLPLCDLLLNLSGRLVMSLTDVSQLAKETVIQWGLTLWLVHALEVFRKKPDFKVMCEFSGRIIVTCLHFTGDKTQSKICTSDSAKLCR
jgi:hypothetical protein